MHHVLNTICIYYYSFVNVHAFIIHQFAVVQKVRSSATYAIHVDVSEFWISACWTLKVWIALSVIKKINQVVVGISWYIKELKWYLILISFLNWKCSKLIKHFFKTFHGNTNPILKCSRLYKLTRCRSRRRKHMPLGCFPQVNCLCNRKLITFHGVGFTWSWLTCHHYHWAGTGKQLGYKIGKLHAGEYIFL